MTRLSYVYSDAMRGIEILMAKLKIGTQNPPTTRQV